MAKAHADSWAATDKFWKQVAPRVPQPERDAGKKYVRRPALPARPTFEAIVHVIFVLRGIHAMPHTHNF